MEALGLLCRPSRAAFLPQPCLARGRVIIPVDKKNTPSHPASDKSDIRMISELVLVKTGSPGSLPVRFPERKLASLLLCILGDCSDLSLNPSGV